MDDVGCQESPFAQVKAFCPESMAVSFFVDRVANFVEIFVFLCFCLFLLNHEYCPLQSIATLGCPCKNKIPKDCEMTSSTSHATGMLEKYGTLPV